MKKLNFIVIPYRDRYFLEKYGNAVRDLHMIQALAACPDVACVSVFNRPVSLHERLLLSKSVRLGTQPHDEFPGVHWVDRTDSALLGPFKKRLWLEHCYRPWHDQISALKKPDATNVLLDFTPLSKIDYASIGCEVTWYDAIDNFTKHNRFSEREIELVEEKYAYVSQRADFISAVSAGALAAAGGGAQGIVVPNGLPIDKAQNAPVARANNAYDFGFMGFVTDKFDIQLLTELSRFGYSVGIFGEVYDRATESQLKRIRGVSVLGGFNQKQASEISRKFRVGLIPYLKRKLHDESPLKLYQYLNWGKPVLASVSYEVNSPYICVYDGLTTQALGIACERLLSFSGDTSVSNEIARSVNNDMRWTCKIGKIIDVIGNLEKLRGL